MGEQHKRPNHLNGLVYSARWALGAAAFLWLAWKLVARQLGNAPHDALAIRLTQLDLYAALVPWLLWAGLLLCVVPLARLTKQRGTGYRAGLGLLLAILSTAPAVVALCLARDDYIPLAALAALTPLALGALLTPLEAKALRYLPLLSDLLLPLPLWRSYAGRSRVLAAFKPLSLLIPLALPVLALFLCPAPRQSLPRVSPQAQQLIAEVGLYQCALDPLERRLWITDDKHTLYLLPLDDPAAYAVQPIDSSQFQYVGFDPARRIAYHLPPGLRELLLIQMDDPSRVERLPLLVKLDKTQVFPIWIDGFARLLISSETQGALLIKPEGEVLQRNADLGTTAFAAWDAQRDRLYIAPHSRSELLALGGATLKIAARLACPPQAGHMALDEQGSTLWTCYPRLGEVRPVDLTRFEFAGRGKVAPGVRVLALDEQRGLLFCGGFSPYLDVLELPSLARVARLSVPGWQRGMFADQEHERLYITTRDHGLWSVDYSRIKGEHNGSMLTDLTLELLRLAARVSGG
ncbi:MAG: hypothetical protein P9M14_10370 [Candidatus Alcyoniella australis]|nr:hypothetical protein [Candidatus Alcyoniella australis]